MCQSPLQVSTLHVLVHLMLTIPNYMDIFTLYFIDKRKKAQRGQITLNGKARPWALGSVLSLNHRNMLPRCGEQTLLRPRLGHKALSLQCPCKMYVNNQNLDYVAILEEKKEAEVGKGFTGSSWGRKSPQEDWQEMESHTEKHKANRRRGRKERKSGNVAVRKRMCWLRSEVSETFLTSKVKADPRINVTHSTLERTDTGPDLLKTSCVQSGRRCYINM